VIWYVRKEDYEVVSSRRFTIMAGQHDSMERQDVKQAGEVAETTRNQYGKQ